MTDRHTRLTDTGGLPELTDDEIARLESENGLLQFDRMAELIEEAVRSGRFRLSPGIITELQRIAVAGLEPSAGTFRTVPVGIQGTPHKPPPAHDVPQLIADLCEYVNDSWAASTALHLAAFVMWRINWIHPFTNGNGRTSRVVSYLVLCARLGLHVPGSPTVPQKVAENKPPYYEALEAADRAWEQGQLDVAAMESLLEAHLTAQLRSIDDSERDL